MLLSIHPQNPQPRLIQTVIECLQSGGVIIYPTDTIYGLGCDIFQTKAVERIAKIKQVDPAKAQLSFVCSNLSDLSKYTKSISTPLYRILKNHLPGPYTFILPASKQVPKILHTKKHHRITHSQPSDCTGNCKPIGASPIICIATRRIGSSIN